MLNWLFARKRLGLNVPEAVGHRVVHGGAKLREPALLDDEVVDSIRELTRVAPLHNTPALNAIEGTRRELGHSVPQVAVFDTAFHSTMPDRASVYAIPYEMAEKHGIRRYGFHGLAHEYMLERYAQLAGVARDDSTIITLQLGNGCSIAAIRNGKSVDTSMGFSPLEGLVMGTRSGDLDPSIPGYLALRERMEIGDIEELLNTHSGLLGMSGRSGDMRELIENAQSGDERSRLAVDAFCYRAKKYVGAYLAVLNGAQALVFGGGIGENSPEVRARVCEDMDWLGVELDRQANTATIGTDACISTAGSRLDVYVLAVDEGSIIARETVRCIRQR